MYCNQQPTTLETRSSPPINKSTLLADLCNVVNIEHNVFMGRGRHQVIIDKRHIVIALYKKYSGYTFKQTGKDCGGYDHTTIIHIVKKINNICEVDEQFKSEVLYYEYKLKNLN
jgi:chromosomal replication initiator protein